MVGACLNSNLIVDDVEEIKLIMNKKNNKKNDMDNDSNNTELKDILVLGKAIYRIMNNSKESKSNKKMFLGKHVIVTLGERGVLWCGQKKILNVQKKIDINSSTHDFDSIFCGDDITSSWLHIPAILLPVSTDNSSPYVLNTNGAGDAFCAGLIRAIILLDNHDIENGIKLGLLSAYNKIISTSQLNYQKQDMKLVNQNN